MVPDIHDERVQKLLKKINSDCDPVYVPVIDELYAIPNECFPNVVRKVTIDGGQIVYGWQIWKGELICEAEFHAVWRSSNGNLIDITPKIPPVERILFVQDGKVKYIGAQVDNIRISCISNVLVNDVIDIHNALFRIRNRGDNAFSHEIRLSRTEAQVYNELVKMNNQIQKHIRQGGHVNSPCFCGSESIYSVCHRNRLDSLIKLSKTF
jgi:hypothetical protein